MRERERHRHRQTDRERIHRIKQRVDGSWLAGSRLVVGPCVCVCVCVCVCGGGVPWQQRTDMIKAKDLLRGGRPRAPHSNAAMQHHTVAG